MFVRPQQVSWITTVRASGKAKVAREPTSNPPPSKASYSVHELPLKVSLNVSVVWPANAWSAWARGAAVRLASALIFASISDTGMAAVTYVPSGIAVGPEEADG